MRTFIVFSKGHWTRSCFVALDLWLLKSRSYNEFPSGPVVRILHSHCQGAGFDPWSGN